MQRAPEWEMQYALILSVTKHFSDMLNTFLLPNILDGINICRFSFPLMKQIEKGPPVLSLMEIVYQTWPYTHKPLTKYNKGMQLFVENFILCT
jgi:hypothetical protein